MIFMGACPRAAAARVYCGTVMAAYPTLVVRVGETEWLRVEAPTDFGERSWVLGVVAVQVTVQDEGAIAIVRANPTGSEPVVRPLASGELVHVTLLDPGGALPPVPRLPDAGEADAPVRLAIFRDGAAVDEATADARLFGSDPQARGF